MLQQLNGATRVHFVVGDPIAQVKSPSDVSQVFQARGRNAIVVPAHVTPADLSSWIQAVSTMRNVDGIIVTVPHKFAAFDLCTTASERASFLQTANVMRRSADGTWHGDTLDGLGFVAALRESGTRVQGRHALLIGAGGAGSAIAHAMVQTGLETLAIHDEDARRRDALIERLRELDQGRVQAGSPDPRSFDIVINATPIGMREGDPLPLDASGLTSAMHVACVITAPAITPLIAKARELGCTTQTGAEMFARVRDLMVDFLLEE